MPKTKKPFDWEVYENGEFIDIITMTRNEVKDYRQSHPNQTLVEIGYTESDDDIWEQPGKKEKNTYKFSRKHKLND